MDDDESGSSLARAPATRGGLLRLPLAALVEPWLRDPPADPPGLDSAQAQRLRRIFVEGGLEALAHATSTEGWVQLGLRPGEEALRGRMYGSVLELARALLQDGSIRGFFFMHKEPGLRLRFELRDAERAALTERLRAGLAAEVAAGSIAALQPGVYEPETALFGGPRSMPHVHRSFTADALMWLQLHAWAHADPRLGGSAWALSFVVLHALFRGLRIVDWEDVDVWDRVRHRLGRRLPPEAASLATLEELCAEIRAAWLDPGRLDAALPEPLVELGRTTARAIEDEAAAWRERYFASDAARIGTRAGAALFVIFHWNRAGLSPTRQALIVESLYRRPIV